MIIIQNVFSDLILAMSASEVQSSLQTWIDEAEALSSKDCRSDDIQFLPEIKVTVSVLTLPLFSVISDIHFIVGRLYM